MQQGRLSTGAFVNWESGHAEGAARSPDLQDEHTSRTGLDDDDNDHDRFSERVTAKLKAEAELDEQLERERKVLESLHHCPEAWRRSIVDLAAYDEQYKGTEKERQAFDESNWDKIEAELRDRPR